MSKLAAMPFFPAEFFADTAHLTPDAAKAYLFLLAHAWLRGAKLPNHDPELARMAQVSLSGWMRSIREPVMAMWTLGEDGFYRQKRLTKEYEFVLQKTNQNRENGKLGGRPRKGQLDELGSSNKKSPSDLPQDQPPTNPLKNNEPPKADGFSEKTETNPPTPTPTEEKKRDTSVSPKEKPIAPPKATRLAKGWEPSFDPYDFGNEVGLTSRQVEDQFARFRDYWTSKPGSAGTKLDWDATLRNWLRKAADDSARAPPHRNGSGRPKSGMMDAIAEMLGDGDDRQRQSENQGDRGAAHPGRLPAPRASRV